MNKKYIFYMLCMILFTLSVTALEQCSYQVYENQVPCYILLPVNKTFTPCDTINVSFYLNETYEGSSMMSDYNDIFCYANFTSSAIGIHSIGYSTQDSGSINVISNFDTFFWVYILTSITFVFLVVYGFVTENYFYLIISGFLACLIGLSLTLIGFPQLNNNFLVTSFSIIFIGIGGYLIIGSWLEVMEEEKW